MNPEPSSAYERIADDSFLAGELTRGPWSPDHQHAGPPTALVSRAIERAAAAQGLTHLARLTANLLRPVPLGELSVAVDEDYAGRNAAHFSARLSGGGKELARFTALMQREVETPTPPGTPGHPLPAAPRRPGDCEPFAMPFAGRQITYADFVETRAAEGRPWAGPCSVWFRMRHPLVEGESPSPYQRVAVAADSGNGISAVLDFARYSFVNCDLTINLLRRPVGDWICLAARTQLGGNGCGLAESTLYDAAGLIGSATQSLAVRLREGPG
ncbi:MAG TPA: thioesterase family protein [Burkholderiaceae bacterium]|nr:thioesterase family protein [Burkholderiaceae bacterium]